MVALGKGWIGVDLDGTLAFYERWIDELHIGEPIPLILARVLQRMSFNIRSFNG